MNLPNILSIIRLILVPVFAAVYFSPIEYANVFAAGIYILASLTDVLDGMIARRYNLITKLGRLLDPLADKIMSVTVVACIAISGVIPLWAVIIFVVKEFLMALGALVLYKAKSDVMPSNHLGKASTAVFFITCMILMLFNLDNTTSTVLIVIAAGFSFVALFVYFYQYMVLAASTLPEGKEKDE